MSVKVCGRLGLSVSSEEWIFKEPDACGLASVKIHCVSIPRSWLVLFTPVLKGYYCASIYVPHDPNANTAEKWDPVIFALYQNNSAGRP